MKLDETANVKSRYLCAPTPTYCREIGEAPRKNDILKYPDHCDRHFPTSRHSFCQALHGHHHAVPHHCGVPHSNWGPHRHAVPHQCVLPLQRCAAEAIPFEGLRCSEFGAGLRRTERRSGDASLALELKTRLERTRGDRVPAGAVGVRTTGSAAVKWVVAMKLSDGCG